MQLYVYHSTRIDVTCVAAAASTGTWKHMWFVPYIVHIVLLVFLGLLLV